MESLDIVFNPTEQVRNWIRRNTEFWSSTQLYSHWLHPNEDQQYKNRSSATGIHIDNVNLLLSKELPDTDRLANNALVSFCKNENPVLHQFHINDNLLAGVTEAEFCGGEVLDAFYSFVCSGSVVFEIPSQVNCVPTFKQNYWDSMLLWNHICGVEKLKELWFNNNQTLIVNRLVGCCSMIEYWLNRAQLLTEDPRLENVIHSASALVGELSIGIIPLESREIKMIVQLHERRSLHVVSGVTNELRLTLQKTFDAVLETGEIDEHVVVSVVNELSLLRSRVCFSRDCGTLLLTARLLFTHKGAFLDIKQYPDNPVSTQSDVLAAFENSRFLHRELFICKEICAHPDLRFGSLLMMEIWRTTSELQNLIEAWDMVCVLWALHHKWPFFDPSHVVLRFFSLLSSFNGVVFDFPLSSAWDLPKKRSCDELDEVNIPSYFKPIRELFLPSRLSTDPLLLNLSINEVRSAHSLASQIPTHLPTSQTTPQSDSQPVGMGTLGYITLMRILHGQLHGILSVPVSEIMTSAMELCAAHTDTDDSFLDNIPYPQLSDEEDQCPLFCRSPGHIGPNTQLSNEQPNSNRSQDYSRTPAVIQPMKSALQGVGPQMENFGATCCDLTGDMEWEFIIKHTISNVAILKIPQKRSKNREPMCSLSKPSGLAKR